MILTTFEHQRQLFDLNVCWVPEMKNINVQYNNCSVSMVSTCTQQKWTTFNYKWTTNQVVLIGKNLI